MPVNVTLKDVRNVRKKDKDKDLRALCALDEERSAGPNPLSRCIWEPPDLRNGFL